MNLVNKLFKKFMLVVWCVILLLALPISTATLTHGTYFKNLKSAYIELYYDVFLVGCVDINLY